MSHTPALGARVAADPCFVYGDAVAHNTARENARIARTARYMLPEFRRRHQRVELDAVAAYSITSTALSHQTAELVAGCLCRDGFSAAGSVITDGTAGTGGNVFGFAAVFRHVNAVDVDATRAQMLLHNVATLALSNVTVFDNDVTDTAALFAEPGFRAQGVLFLDPPWGGAGYAAHARLSLALGGVPLADVCRAWAPHAPYIALKLPCNFAFAAFAAATADCLAPVLRQDMHEPGARNCAFVLLVLRARRGGARPWPKSHRASGA